MIAQEGLTMLLTAGGVTSSVGIPQDTLTVWIETKALDFGDAERAKFLDEIILGLSRRVAQINMSLEIYGADDEDGPFILLDTVAVSGAEPLVPDVPGQRFFKFKFIDRGVRERWRLFRFEVFGEMGGDEF